MVVMVLFYLVHKVLCRIFEFFRHWYVDGFRLYWNFIVRSLEWFDRYFALHKSRSALGRALGIPLRFGRILVGGIVYTLFLFVAAAVFLVWLLAVPYLLVRIIFG